MNIKKNNTLNVSTSPLWGAWGRRVVKNIPFFLYGAFLCVLYIANGHYGEKMIRHIGKLGKENKELMYEYKTLNGNLMFQSKQSQLVKVVEKLGLQLPTEMPIVITDSTEIIINN